MGAVVDTDPASADADYDNGPVAVYGTPRCGRREGAASRWVATDYSEAVGRFYRLLVGQRQLGQRLVWRSEPCCLGMESGWS